VAPVGMAQPQEKLHFGEWYPSRQAGAVSINNLLMQVSFWISILTCRRGIQTTAP